LGDLKTETVTTGLLGKTKFSKVVYENSGGMSIVFDDDYSGVKLAANPTPGLFEWLKEGDNPIKVW
jgi:hypothetical protein